jgi:tRNA (adenine22-N1)-methyltransferase
VQHAYASDIRPGPLEAAKETIRLAGLQDRITPVLCPGLEAFGPEQAEAVVICGMGGETIAAILEAAPWTAAGKHKLVLQPMTQAPRLRKWLREHGYRIRQERLAQEGKRLYCLLEVWGGAPDADAAKYGDLFTESLRQDPLFPAFVQAQLTRYSRIAAGQAQSEADGEGEDLQQILAILKEQANGTR